MRRCFRQLCLRILSDGTKLDGKFSNDRLVDGTATLPDGRTYTGKFCEATGTPLPDTMLFEDGDVYQGAFNSRWQRHGEGAAWLADGTKYAGSFADDELVHGIVRIPEKGGELTFTGTLKDEQFVKGRLLHPEYEYVGEFENNQPHGRGRLDFVSGAYQEGTFRRGSLHGEQGKMRLESGHIYTGSFIDGRCTEGTLRTPTFTYEGSFNDQGMADGEGRAEYLTMDPRIIFTGIWRGGSMIEGTAADEFGSPVDYRNSPEMVQELGGKDSLLHSDKVYAALDDAVPRFREMNDGYVADAAAARSSGRTADKVALGYEAPVGEGQDKLYQSQARTQAQPHSTGEGLAREVAKAAPGREYEYARQQGHQEVVAGHAAAQFARFMSDAATTSAASAEPKRVIDTNAPWKDRML